MSAGLQSILARIAEQHVEKQAFVPMAGGAPQGGAPMDPAMAGGPPMDPSMAAVADPAMMAAAQGMPPSEMAAMQGMPVDPAMAAAGGAPVDPSMMGAPMDPAMGGAPMGLPPEIQSAIDEAVAKSGGGAVGEKPAGASGGKAKVEEQLLSLNSKLDQVLGYIMGKGGPVADALSGGVGGSGAPADMAPAAAMDAPAAMGAPTADADPVADAAAESAPKLASVQGGSVAKRMANLMSRRTA